MSNRLGVLALTLFGLTALTARAEKKTVLVATGDCSDPVLVTSARDLRDAASKLLGPQLMEGEVVLDIVRPRPTRSVSELERQIDSARTLFYGGQPERAQELVDRALEELERASPEAKPWPATVNALVLKALIAKGAEKTKEMNDAFRRIARIDLSYKLDPDAYPPSAVSAFESVKKEVMKSKKLPVLLRPETGSAQVFVDGLALGQSPVTAMLLPGTYRVSMVQGTQVSFPHRIEIPRDLKLNVDLAFEGSVGTQPPLCLTGAAEGSAVKLAQLVAAERVIVLRNVAKRGEPPFLSGTVFDLATGKQEREGSVQPELIGNLATFLITGKDATGVQKPAPPVVAVKEPPPPPKKDPEPVVAVKKDAPVADPDPALKAPDSTPPPPAVSASPGTARTVSGVLIGAGGAAVLAGVIIFAVGGCDAQRCDRDRFAAIAPGGMLPPATSSAGVEALELQGKIDANRTGSFALIGVGVGSAVAGIVGLAIFPSAPAQVTIAPTREGGMVGVSGSF